MAGAYKEVKQEPEEHAGQSNVDPNYEAKEKDGDEFGIGVGSGFGKCYPLPIPRTPSMPYSPIAVVPTTPRPKGPPQGPSPATPPFNNKPLPPVPVFGGGPAAPASSEWGHTADSFGSTVGTSLLANHWAQWQVSRQEGRNRLDYMQKCESEKIEAFNRGRQIGVLEGTLAQQAATASIMQTPQPY